MVKRRRGLIQQPVEIELSGGRGQQIAAPHHLADAHAGVVHHHGQLVGVDPVGAADDEIAAVAQQVFAVVALETVAENNGLVRNLQPPGGLPARGPVLWAQAPAGAGIDGLPVGGVGRGGGVELSAGAVAGVYQSLRFQRFKSGAVIFRPPRLRLALPVPVQAQPFEVAPDGVGIDRLGAIRVQVLDAQEHTPAHRPDGQPGQQGGEHVSQVHHPRGTGGKPAHSSGVHINSRGSRCSKARHPPGRGCSAR